MESMSCFTVFPAMDVRRGQVVRLKQGDPQQMTVFSEDVLAAATQWIACGARWLHVVNLDGAFGEMRLDQQALLERLVQVVHRYGARLQLGGGLRSWEDIQQAFARDVDRVIVGTAAFEQPDLLRRALDRFGPQQVAVAVDIRQGRVYLRGWRQAGSGSALEALRAFWQIGAQVAVVTDIERDGMESGLNVPLGRSLVEQVPMQIVLAGGLSSLDEVRAARRAGLAGVILGRALYKGQVDLRLALQEEVPC